MFASVDFVLGTQAPGAQVKALLLPVYSNSSRVYIGSPAPVGPALGVADIMTEKRRFTAQIAFQFRFSLNYRRDTIAISCE